MAQLSARVRLPLQCVGLVLILVGTVWSILRAIDLVLPGAGGAWLLLGGLLLVAIAFAATFLVRPIGHG